MPTRRSLLAKLGLLAGSAAVAVVVRDRLVWPRPEIGFGDGADGSGWLALSPAAPLPIVPVQVNGVLAQALLDTGAEASALDRALGDQLGLGETALLPVVAFGVNGAPKVGRSASIAVSLGRASLRSLRVAVLDLGPIAQVSPGPVALILGLDALSAFVLDLDLRGEAGRVALLRPGPRAPFAGAVTVPSERRGRQLTTWVQVNGQPVQVVVDTGASAGLALASDVAQRLGLLSGGGGRALQSFTFGGVSRDRLIQVEAVTFAGETLADVSVQVFPRAPMSPTPDGLLGLGLLQGRRVRIDPATPQILLGSA